MKTYQEFEIQSQDQGARLLVRGATLQELFRNALRGTFLYVSPEAAKPAAGTTKITRDITARAVDIASLLVEFISRALAEADTHGAVFTHAVFRAFGDNFLDAELTGIAVDHTEAEIRAVSYAEVDIRKNQDTGLFETTLAFEI